MKLLIALVLSLSIFTIVGCDSGPQKAKVSGTVTLDGNPLEEATVQFDANDGSVPEIVKIAEGEFSGEVTPGMKTLRFRAMRLAEKLSPTKMENRGGGMKPPYSNILPQKYGRGSDIQLDVLLEGNAELKYELKSK